MEKLDSKSSSVSVWRGFASFSLCWLKIDQLLKSRPQVKSCCLRLLPEEQSSSVEKRWIWVSRNGNVMGSFFQFPSIRIPTEQTNEYIFFLKSFTSRRTDDRDFGGRLRANSFWQIGIWIRRRVHINSIICSICTNSIPTERAQSINSLLISTPQEQSSRSNRLCKNSSWYFWNMMSSKTEICYHY